MLSQIKFIFRISIAEMLQQILPESHSGGHIYQSCQYVPFLINFPSRISGVIPTMLSKLFYLNFFKSLSFLKNRIRRILEGSYQEFWIVNQQGLLLRSHEQCLIRSILLKPLIVQAIFVIFVPPILNIIDSFAFSEEKLAK